MMMNAAMLRSRGGGGGHQQQSSSLNSGNLSASSSTSNTARRKKRRKKKQGDNSNKMILVSLVLMIIFISMIGMALPKTASSKIKSSVISVMKKEGYNNNDSDSKSNSNNELMNSNNDNIVIEREKRHVQNMLKRKSKYAQGGVGSLRLNKNGEGSLEDNPEQYSAGLRQVLDDARAEARKLKIVPVEGEDIDEDKEEIYEILRQAGIDKKELDDELRGALPTWTKVQQLYGTHPIIIGLEESCSRFSPKPDWSMAFFGIAGFFNTGTNLLAELLIQNCEIRERMEIYGEDARGMRWQVPWGKHTPIQYRKTHVTTTDHDIPTDNSFPMVTIRDPYQWLGSMCRHRYSARWRHNKTNCPNLDISNIHSNQRQKNPVVVKYKETPVKYKSLPDLYNDWYNDYMNTEEYGDFARVFVRFEDLMFYGKNVTETLCKCGGGTIRQDHDHDFYHVGASAKVGIAAHGTDKTNLLQALIRYGHASSETRTKGLSKRDLQAAKEWFDPKLLDLFHYSHPI